MNNRLKEFRKKKKLTQEQLGERLDVTKQYISGIENENIVPSLRLAHKIAEELETSIYSIFDLYGNGKFGCLN